jgi:hypothetical protein
MSITSHEPAQMHWSAPVWMAVADCLITDDTMELKMDGPIDECLETWVRYVCSCATRRQTPWQRRNHSSSAAYSTPRLNISCSESEGMGSVVPSARHRGAGSMVNLAGPPMAR